MKTPFFCTFYELNYVYFAKISEKKCNFACKIMSKGNASVRLIERLMLGIIVLFVFGPMSAQTKRALVIDISEYSQHGNISWGSIHGSNDADLFIPVLKAQVFKTTKVCNKSAIV